MNSDYDTSWSKIKKVFLMAGISIMVYYIIHNSEVINQLFFTNQKEPSSKRFFGFLLFSIVKYVAIIATFVFSALVAFLIYKRSSSDS